MSVDDSNDKNDEIAIGYMRALIVVLCDVEDYYQSCTYITGIT